MISTTEGIIAIIGSVFALMAMLWKGARALIRTASAGQRLTESVLQNTTAIQQLSNDLRDLTAWRALTEQRLVRLEHPGGTS